MLLCFEPFGFRVYFYILYLRTLKMEIFNRKKATLLIIILLILFAGFFLMAGPMPEKDNFNPEIYSFRRITLAPVVIILSYCGIIFLILKRK